jgi:ADP-ribose pyrophosphatase
MTMIKKWTVSEEKKVIQTPIFSLSEMKAQSPLDSTKSGNFVYLDVPSWVNVIAITPNNKVVLIKQYRHGNRQVTIEIPGGMCDKRESKRGVIEEDFISAGLRELREETGYIGTEVKLIGIVEPNPAFQNNFCGTILVKNAHQTQTQELDSHEEIMVYTRPLADIPEMIRSRQITHSLVVAAFHHLSLLET